MELKCLSKHRIIELYYQWSKLQVSMHKCMCLMHNALDLRGLQLESREREMGQEFMQKSCMGKRQGDLGLIETLFTNISRDNFGLTAILCTN